MEQKGKTIGINRTEADQPNAVLPELQTPPAAGKTVGLRRKPTEFEQRVAELAAQRDAAEKAYQAELAKAN